MRVVFEFEDCRGCPYRRLSLTNDWECTKQKSQVTRRAKMNPDGSIEGAKIITIYGYETLEEMFKTCPIKFDQENDT